MFCIHLSSAGDKIQRPHQHDHDRAGGALQMRCQICKHQPPGVTQTLRIFRYQEFVVTVMKETINISKTVILNVSYY